MNIGIGWNPVKGLCPVGCDYCYARRIYNSFHYDSTIRFDAKEFHAVEKLKKPARIFVGSTIELFGEWVPKDWIDAILEQARSHSQHTFIFLSKRPERFRFFDFPDNCWTGVTITQENPTKYFRIEKLWEANAPVHFISFEPLHSAIKPGVAFIFLNWVIIGAETGNRKGKIAPKEEWIRDILSFADDEEVPVFMKDNLPKFPHIRKRQEFPK